MIGGAQTLTESALAVPIILATHVSSQTGAPRAVTEGVLVSLLVAAAALLASGSRMPSRGWPGGRQASQRKASGSRLRRAARALAGLLSATKDPTLPFAQLIDRYTAVLRSGATTTAAWTAIAHHDARLTANLRSIAIAGSHGGPLAPAIRKAQVGSAGTAVLAALDLAENFGAPLSRTLDTVADGLRDTADAERARESAFAGPTSTARILSCLPVAGLTLGWLMGADPLRILTSTPIGSVFLLGGIGLNIAGWLWSRALVRRARGSRS